MNDRMADNHETKKGHDCILDAVATTPAPLRTRLPPQNTNITAPALPSSLRNSSIPDLTPKSNLGDTPESTPTAATGAQEAKVFLAAQHSNVTPPDSVRAASLLFPDADRTPTNVRRSVSADGRLIAHIDDPFDPADTTTQLSTDVLTANTSTGLAHDTIARIASSLSIPSGYDYVPRSDRLQELPNAQNAQGLFPPDAAIFVANLPNRRSDDQLEVFVHKEFNTYGQCYIKIRRDKNGQPYGLIQYERPEDARLALDSTRGLVICGRMCRTEQALTPCSVILTRIGGGRVTEEETRGVLEPFGAIKSCYPVTRRELYNNPGWQGGMWAVFAFYADRQDAAINFRNQSHYRLWTPPTPKAPYRGGQRQRYEGLSHLAQRTTLNDARTIFVGDIPAGAYEETLRQAFAPFGRVLQVVLKKRYDLGGTRYAFIEFETDAEADNMCQIGLIGIAGATVHVQPKRPSQPHYPDVSNQYAQSAPDFNGHGTVMPPAPPHFTMAALYNHALQLGVAPEQAMAVLNFAPVQQTPFYYNPETFYSTQY